MSRIKCYQLVISSVLEKHSVISGETPIFLLVIHERKMLLYMILITKQSTYVKIASKDKLFNYGK